MALTFSEAAKKFIEAAKKAGYMKKGKAFKPLPKKGSPPYKKILARMRK